jgi:hypothetical protein
MQHNFIRKETDIKAISLVSKSQAIWLMDSTTTSEVKGERTIQEQLVSQTTICGVCHVSFILAIQNKILLYERKT